MCVPFACKQFASMHAPIVVGVDVLEHVASRASRRLHFIRFKQLSHAREVLGGAKVLVATVEDVMCVGVCARA